MTWDDAIKKMITEYWEGDGYEQAKSFEKAKYNKKYFQGMEDEFFPKSDKLDKTKPKGKK